MHESRTSCDNASNETGLKIARAEYWRSAEDLEKTQEFRELMAREFGPNAQDLASGEERRTFIKLMGAGFALVELAVAEGVLRRWRRPRPHQSGSHDDPALPGRGLEFSAPT